MRAPISQADRVRFARQRKEAPAVKRQAAEFALVERARKLYVENGSPEGPWSRLAHHLRVPYLGAASGEE